MSSEVPGGIVEGISKGILEEVLGEVPERIVSGGHPEKVFKAIPKE